MPRWTLHELYIGSARDPKDRSLYPHAKLLMKGDSSNFNCFYSKKFKISVSSTILVPLVFFDQHLTNGAKKQRLPQHSSMPETESYWPFARYLTLGTQSWMETRKLTPLSVYFVCQLHNYSIMAWWQRKLKAQFSCYYPAILQKLL